MTMLENLAGTKQDLILLAEIGALIHDLGKLSKEFVTNPGEAHSQILSRDTRGYDPYQTGEADKICTYFGIIAFHLEHNEEVKKRLSDSQRQEIAALADGIWIRWQTKGGDLDQVHDELRAALSNSLLLKPAAPILVKYLDGYQRDVLDIPDKIRQAERLFADVASPQTVQVLEAPSFEAVLQLTSIEGIRQVKRLGDFVVLHHQTPVCPRPTLIALLRAPDGVDGFDSWIDKGQVSEDAKQDMTQTLIATAFGHEAQQLPVGPDEDGLKPVRDRFAEILAEELCKVQSGQATLAQVRPRIFAEAEIAFRQALGETRRPANDVTLWDHCYSVASLYKAALSKVLIEDKWTEPQEIGWRFLRVGVDGLRFFAQAHHVTDMLGRRQALMDVLNQVRDALEVNYPLGNEVYRDENGSVFVMPGVGDEIYEKLAGEIKELVLKTFRRASVGGELVPRIAWNKRGPVREEMVSDFGELATRDLPPSGPDPKALGNWWQGVRAEGKEICTVCGQRPVGYVESESENWATSQKAEERNVCGICLHRRGRRAHDWARNKPDEGETISPFERTIWIDEVADDNGRFALVVGRFGLAGWLDGKLVRTMLVNPTDSKNPSPARIRRCWETTRQFWQDIQQQTLPENVKQRLRLGIRPANVPAINHPEGGLGRWHTYEADINGRRLGLCWDPNDEMATDRNLFWTTDNLRYLGRQLGIKDGALKSDDDLQAAFLPYINGQTLTLYEPGGYLGQERRASVDAESCLVVEKKHFQPFIPLLVEPVTFMALVPACAALKVVRAIKEKYDTEMARVRDRLPLHLGLVFAPRRTPLAAVLETGRAMLGPGDRGLGIRDWEAWQIVERSEQRTCDEAPSDLKNDPQFKKWWHVPLERSGRKIHLRVAACMGDGETEDKWYPHLRRERSKAGDDANVVHVRELERGQTVWFRPSRFDFEFLDTTARRFEMHYGDDGHRARRTRPFLLEDLNRLDDIWGEVKGLEKSQRHQVIAAIEATREAWFGDDREGHSLTDGTFRQFVRDTLAGAAWPKGHAWSVICDAGKDTALENAGVSGELADLAELHMHILKE